MAHADEKVRTIGELIKQVQGAKTITLAEFFDRLKPRIEFELMESDEWFSSIPGVVGLWATGATQTLARDELMSALLGWWEVQQHEMVDAMPFPVESVDASPLPVDDDSASSIDLKKSH